MNFVGMSKLENETLIYIRNYNIYFCKTEKKNINQLTSKKGEIKKNTYYEKSNYLLYFYKWEN